METSMDRTALAAALAAGLLAPAGGMADDQDHAEKSVICGEPAAARDADAPHLHPAPKADAA